MIPLFKVYMNPDVDKPLSEVLHSGYIGQGKKVEELEDKLKSLFTNDNVLLTNSCTSSIHLALDVIRETHDLIPSETDVLCTCLSCLATALPIKSQGFNIKWVDVNDSLNIDLKDLEKKLTCKTRVVVLVHWGGNPVDMLEVQIMKNEYFEKYNKELFVIEDCAHCLDTRMNMGGFGVNIGYNVYRNYLCYSFQAIKFLTTVDGGCLITPQETYKQAKLKRWFGIDRDSGASMRCIQKLDYVGFKFQPNDVLATIGLANFNDSISNQYKHKKNAKYYDIELSYIKGIRPINYSNGYSSCWLYTVFVERKEDFKRMMTEKEIEVSEVHQRMDTQPVFKDSKIELPNMDSFESQYVCIPVGWWVTENDRKYIIDCIRGGW